LTTAEYIVSLRSQATALKDGRALQMAANTVHGERVERIFDTGAVARGYSTKPMWMSNKDMRGGVNKGKSGKAKKTSYFQGGYREYKTVSNFASSNVNFRNTNDLQSDFSNGRVTTKVNNFLFVEEIKRDDNMDKLDGNQKRFGNFLKFTPSDITRFNSILERELVSILRGER